MPLPFPTCRWLDFELPAPVFLCLRLFSSPRSLLVGLPPGHKHLGIKASFNQWPKISGASVLQYLTPQWENSAVPSALAARPPEGFCSNSPWWHLINSLLLTSFYPFFMPPFPYWCFLRSPPTKLILIWILCLGSAAAGRTGTEISHFTKSEKHM